MLWLLILKNGNFKQGLIDGIIIAGEQLKNIFLGQKMTRMNYQTKYLKENDFTKKNTNFLYYCLFLLHK
jgi:hypothetical protein